MNEIVDLASNEKLNRISAQIPDEYKNNPEFLGVLEDFESLLIEAGPGGLVTFIMEDDSASLSLINTLCTTIDIENKKTGYLGIPIHGGPLFIRGGSQAIRYNDSFDNAIKFWTTTVKDNPVIMFLDISLGGEIGDKDKLILELEAIKQEKNLKNILVIPASAQGDVMAGITSTFSESQRISKPIDIDKVLKVINSHSEKFKK